MGHGDAGNGPQAFAQAGRHGIDIEGSLFPVGQAHVHTGVHLAQRIASVDGGQGIADLREFAQDGFHLAGLGLGGLQ